MGSYIGLEPKLGYNNHHQSRSRNDQSYSSKLLNTVHRFCMWHILNKFSEKLDAIKLKDHYHRFQKCIWNSETLEQFETQWSEIIEQSGLSTNEWLKTMYDIRSKWIPAFINDTFSAGMSSRQRVESFHAFFKSYVSKKNSLMDFMVRFARAVKHQRYQELSIDHKDINEQPIMKTMFSIEKSMSELYTHSIFYKVQDELFQSMTYIARIENKGEGFYIYNVGRADSSLQSLRVVVENKTLDRMSCSCKKFESYGFICCHIFASFNRMQLHTALPSTYVLHRWTKSAKAMCSYGGSQEIGLGVVLRHNTLTKLTKSIIEAALVNDDTYKVAIEMLESL